jgi:hypothetical protein
MGRGLGEVRRNVPFLSLDHAMVRLEIAELFDGVEGTPRRSR